jgi:hypothetical protein
VVPYLGLPVFAPDPAQEADLRQRRLYSRWMRLLRSSIEGDRVGAAARDADHNANQWAANAAASRDWADHHLRRGENDAAQRWWDQHLTELNHADAWRAERDAILAGARNPVDVTVADRAWSGVNQDDGILAPGAVDTGTASALTGRDDPLAAERHRPYGRRGGLRPPLAVHQQDLEAAMPRDATGRVLRTPDPRDGTWLRFANDGGAGADPTRGINCQDCVLSFVDTWLHGRPRVSAPRTFDGYHDANVNRPMGGEHDGPRRAEEATGGRYQSLLDDVGTLDPASAARATDNAFAALEAQLRAGGHGSMAMLINGWSNGSAHAWAAVNQNGTILYVDPQRGEVSDRGPLYTDVTRIDALVLGADGKPLPLADRPRGAWSALPPLDTDADDQVPLSVLDTSTPAGLAPPGGPLPKDPESSPPPRSDLERARELRDQRLAAQAHFDAGGVSVRSAVDAAPDLDAVFAAGVRPADVAAHLDAPTLARLMPDLPPADVERAARFFADPDARVALEKAWTDAPNGEPMLAELLVKELPTKPQLLDVLARSPELHHSLLARPLTLHHVAAHPQAIATLAEIVTEIGRSPANPAVDMPPRPGPAPLTERQAAVSAAASVAFPVTEQAGFDRARRGDPSYVAEYLDGQYRAARVAQAELNQLARRVSRDIEGSKAGWRTQEKDRRRALDKIAHYGNVASRLTDLAGAKIEFATLSDLYDALQLITDSDDFDVVRFDDRFLAPMKSGYRDVQMLLRLSNGHLGEFRLHLSKIDAVAEWEHALFEVRRDLDSLAKDAGRDLTDVERAIRDSILRVELNGFHEALMSSLGHEG